MGSKRSSKNPNNLPSSTPPAEIPVDGSHKTLKNSNLDAPSKSRKKPKLSAPISTDSSNHFADGEVHSQDINRKGKASDVFNGISPSGGTASPSNLFRWSESHKLKLLKSAIALGMKGGSLLWAANLTDLLKEIKVWAPDQFSEKELHSKLCSIRSKFLRSPKPGPESSEFDRSFYELASKVWGPENLKAEGDAAGGVKEQGRAEGKDNASGKREKVHRKPKEGKKKLDEVKEHVDAAEEAKRDNEKDEGTEEKTEKNMILENGEGQDKVELLVDGDNGLFDAKEAGHSYKYLGLALEEYWTESKLNLDTLHAALHKVNPVQAKRLDESFREVFMEMLKFKMEKNKISNEIIRASLGC